MAETLEPFDIESLTVGEVAMVQEASGLEFRQLIGPYRLVLALFVQRLRSSGQPPSWQELTNLRVIDISSGQPPSDQDSQSPK